MKIETPQDILDHCAYHDPKVFAGMNETESCRRWTHGRSQGYPIVYRDGKSVGVHRLMMELTLGRKLDHREFVCHKCNFKLCCNPAHLYVGSHAENMRDRSRAVAERKARKKAEFEALPPWERKDIRRREKMARRIQRESMIPSAAMREKMQKEARRHHAMPAGGSSAP